MSKGSLECFSLQYRSFARLSSCPSAASTAAGITTKSNLRALSDVRAILYILFFGETATQSSIAAEGTVYTARVLSRSDLDRQIVRSSTCEISIPELELTLPATSRGQMTTIEGLVRDIYRDLSMDQPLRMVHDPTGYEKVRTLLDKMKEILGDEDEDEEVDQGAAKQSTSAVAVDKPMPSFTVRLDDPAGNSFIEFVDSMADPKWNLRTYQRTLQQNVDLNLINPDEVQVSTVQGVSVDDILKGDIPVKEVAERKGDGEEANSGDPPPVTSDEVFVFPGPCSSCGHHINTLMKRVNIPHFKVCLFMDRTLPP